MKKPKKKIFFKRDFSRVSDYNKAKLKEEGYNQAIEDYEAYLKSNQSKTIRKILEEVFAKGYAYNPVARGDKEDDDREINKIISQAEQQIKELLSEERVFNTLEEFGLDLEEKKVKDLAKEICKLMGGKK